MEETLAHLDFQRIDAEQVCLMYYFPSDILITSAELFRVSDRSPTTLTRGANTPQAVPPSNKPELKIQDRHRFKWNSSLSLGSGKLQINGD